MSRKLDYRKIKDSFSMLQALEHYGVRLAHVNGNSWRGDCPLPTHDASASRNSFTVTEGKTGWGWNCQSDSCAAARGDKKDGGETKKGGNAIDFIRHMEKLGSFYEAAARINEWLGLEAWLDDSGGRGGETPRTQPKEERVAGRNIPLSEKHPGFTGLKGINPEHPEIQKRGITTETAQAFGVGFFPGKGSMEGRIVFPLHEDGNLIGYAGRATNGKEPKWLLPAGLIKSFLYGLERCEPNKPLIVVESCWGVLFFHQQGQQAAALLGSELTAQQEVALAPFKTLILALDNDQAGHDKAQAISDRLKPTHTVLKAFLKE